MRQLRLSWHLIILYFIYFQRCFLNRYMHLSIVLLLHRSFILRMIFILWLLLCITIILINLLAQVLINLLFLPIIFDPQTFGQQLCFFLRRQVFELLCRLFYLLLPLYQLFLPINDPVDGIHPEIPLVIWGCHQIINSFFCVEFELETPLVMDFCIGGAVDFLYFLDVSVGDGFVLFVVTFET